MLGILGIGVPKFFINLQHVVMNSMGMRYDTYLRTQGNKLLDKPQSFSLEC